MEMRSVGKRVCIVLLLLLVAPMVAQPPEEKNGEEKGIVPFSVNPPRTIWINDDPDGDMHSSYRAIAIEDLNGDGVPDVVSGQGGGSEKVYVTDGATGSTLWSYDPRALQGCGFKGPR